MYPKFIIVTSPGEMDGYFRYGRVVNHRDLAIPYEKVHGGGWFDKDDNNRRMILYGFSIDFGEPDFSFLDILPRDLEGYTFYYTDKPYWFPGDPVEKMDISHVRYL